MFTKYFKVFTIFEVVRGQGGGGGGGGGGVGGGGRRDLFSITLYEIENIGQGNFKNASVVLANSNLYNLFSVALSELSKLLGG